MKKIKVLSGLMAALMGILSFSSLPSVDAKDLDSKKVYCVEVSKEEKQKLEEVLEKIKDEAKIKESNPKSVSFVAKVRGCLKSICTYSVAGACCCLLFDQLNKENENCVRVCNKLSNLGFTVAIATSFSSIVLKILS